MGVSVVDDDGLVQLKRKADLRLKQRQLCVLRHRPVVVQPALAHSDHFRVVVAGGKGFHLSGPVAAKDRDSGGRAFLAAVLGGQQALGMDADGGIHPRIAVGQFQHPGRVPRVGGLLADADHALFGQAVQQSEAVGVEGAGAVVGVGVEDRAGH